jgi:uncharacterized protein involved in exopolysaccharide biosynthesis
MIPKPAPYPQDRASGPEESLREARLSATFALPAESAEDPAAEVLKGRERLVLRLRRVWRGRRVVVRAAGLGFLVSAVIAFVLPREYLAVTRLMPPDSSSASAGGAILAAATGAAGSNLGSLAGGLLGFRSSGALFVGILQSATVQDHLVRKFELQRVYRDRYGVDARGDLADHSSIFEDRKSGIITIAVRDRDPGRAAAIAQGYTEELNTVVNQMSTSSARREREFLEERLKGVQSDLSEAERDWSDFASRNGAIDIQAQGKAMIEGAATLQGRLIAAESELQGLRQIYTEENVRTRSLRAEIAELRGQLAKLDGTGPAAELPPGERPADANFPSIRKLPLLGVAYADLFRREKTEEAVFEALTREYELAKVQEAKETPTVKVLDPAELPEKKSFPPRMLIVLAGTSMAAVAGFAWLVTRSLWAEADPGDPRREFALEVYRDASARTSWRALQASISTLARRAAGWRTKAREAPAVEHDRTSEEL